MRVFHLVAFSSIHFDLFIFYCFARYWLATRGPLPRFPLLCKMFSGSGLNVNLLLWYKITQIWRKLTHFWRFDYIRGCLTTFTRTKCKLAQSVRKLMVQDMSHGQRNSRSSGTESCAHINTIWSVLSSLLRHFDCQSMKLHPAHIQNFYHLFMHVRAM